MARLEVITGPMFSGKSEEVIRRLVRSAFAEKIILVARPKEDNRNKRNIFDLIAENRHLNLYGRISTGIIENFHELRQLIGPGTMPDVIAIDEGQFLGNWIVNSALELLDIFDNQDFRLIISGLDMDALKVPFGPMPQLMAMADEVVKLTAICDKCKTNSGTLTYNKFPQLKATNLDENEMGQKNQIKTGDKEIYGVRCRACHKFPPH